MNKKLIISIIFSLLALILSAFFYQNYLEKKLVKELGKNTHAFVEVWGTFEDESSDKYLDSIKPFMTASLYDKYKSDALNLRELSKGYEGTVDSEIKIKKIILRNSKDNVYNFEAEVTQSSKILNENKEKKIEVSWTKESNAWKASKITASK